MAMKKPSAAKRMTKAAPTKAMGKKSPAKRMTKNAPTKAMKPSALKAMEKKMSAMMKKLSAGEKRDLLARVRKG
tara:strand:- start:85 stop:306 length:222 start_codon:yes stop_codon:yes gene_type:complete